MEHYAVHAGHSSPSNADATMMIPRTAIMTWMLGVTIATPLLSTNVPAIAQSCIPLQVVGGNGTQVVKKVSLPGAFSARSNWNTDFVVPSNQAFQKYIAAIVPRNQGNYTIQMFLKYGNNTADKVYDQKMALPENQVFELSGAPRVDAIPYQVNLSVGGVAAVGNTYKASVWGCH